jgi:hypothetical protein
MINLNVLFTVYVYIYIGLFHQLNPSTQSLIYLQAISNNHIQVGRKCLKKLEMFGLMNSRLVLSFFFISI